MRYLDPHSRRYDKLRKNSYWKGVDEAARGVDLFLINMTDRGIGSHAQLLYEALNRGVGVIDQVPNLIRFDEDRQTIEEGWNHILIDIVYSTDITAKIKQVLGES